MALKCEMRTLEDAEARNPGNHSLWSRSSTFHPQMIFLFI